MKYSDGVGWSMKHTGDMNVNGDHKNLKCSYDVDWNVNP